MINTVIIIGRIVKDPILRDTGKGANFVIFRLANHYNNKVNYVSCIAWKGIATFIDTYLGKGSLIGIEGSIQSFIKNNKKQNIILVKYLKVFIKKPQTDKIYEKLISDNIHIEIIDYEDELEI